MIVTIHIPDSYQKIANLIPNLEAHAERNAPCPACNGTGWTAIDPETACQFCNGVAWKDWMEE